MRIVEARARESNAGAGVVRRGKAARDARVRTPIRRQAAREIAETLGGALGAEVRVKATRDGGYRAELSFATPEEALELARRLRPNAAA